MYPDNQALERSFEGKKEKVVVIVLKLLDDVEWIQVLSLALSYLCPSLDMCILEWYKLNSTALYLLVVNPWWWPLQSVSNNGRIISYLSV